MANQRSTAARVGPRQSGPPRHVLGQRDFVLAVLRQAGTAGISKNQFREGSHTLLRGRRVVEIAARITELEKSGFIFEHAKGRDRLVTYILQSEPLEPKPVQRAPGWKSQGFNFGSQAAPQPATESFSQSLLWEMGKSR